MRTRPVSWTLVCTALLLIVGGVTAQNTESPDIVILNAWVRPTAALPTIESAGAMGGHGGHGGMTPAASGAVSAAYMRIINRMGEPIRFVSANFIDANITEIHEMAMEGDVMRMREVGVPLILRDGERLDLRPAGYHVMLMDLQRDLFPQDAVSLTLTFETDSGVIVEKTIGALVTDTPLEASIFEVFNASAALTTGDRIVIDPSPVEVSGDAPAFLDVYLTISNPAASPLSLIGAESPAAEAAELRRVQIIDNQLTSRVQEFFPMPPRRNLLLSRTGGLIIRLSGINPDLAVGDAVPLRLLLSNETSVTLGVPIVAAPNTAEE